ncbi:MAG: hypothetical protein E6Q97_20490 [Desulfurellales bacterium]|nr:MAG: hypothetical protein E6Q97_20490 [Desulfurellales bacterium]
MDPWDILNTGAPIDIDNLLNSPMVSGLPVVGGGDILVSSGADPDLAALLGVATSGGGDILTGAAMNEIDQLLETSGIATGALNARQKMKIALQLAARKGQQLGQKQGAAAAQRIAAPQRFGVQAMVTDEKDSKYSLQPIGFDSETDILPGQSRLIKQQPQKRAKPKRLVIDEPQFWRVKGIYVGNKPQFLAQGSIPGIMFAYDAVGVELIGDTCQIGQDLIVDVENRSGANHRFEGALQCHAID